MKKKILFTLSLLLLLAWKPTANVFAARGLPVHIHQGGDVDNEVVNVSKSDGDELVWYSEDDPFTITFQTSPFANSTFHVPAGGSINSGPVASGAGVGEVQRPKSTHNEAGVMSGPFCRLHLVP
jgi:hypothetical protein